METPKKSPLWIIIFTIFVDMLGVGILIPVIPQLLANPNSPYYLLSKGMGVSEGFILLGFLTASYPIAQFFAAPILGELSDKYGRKRILAFSLAGTSVSYVMFAIGIFLRNIPLLFLSRAFDGVTGGNISVAQAAIADVTTAENRAKNFGLIGAAFGIGFIIGPFIGGKLSDPTVYHGFNATTPFYFAALLSLMNVVFVITGLPETHFVRKLTGINWGRSIKNIVHAYYLKDLRVLFSVNFLIQGGFTFFTTFFSVYLISRFHFSQGGIGDFFAYVGLWIAFTQAVVTRKVSVRFGEAAVLRSSILGIAIAIVAYFVPTASWQLFFITPFFAIANGLTQANITALISRSANKDVQGEILGINSSVQALAQSIPPILSGYIAADLNPQAPLVISAVVIAIAALIFMVFYKKPVTSVIS